MKIVEQSWEWKIKPELPLLYLEKIGRTCYKSTSAFTKESGEKFVKMILKNGHHSVIEHINASVRFITNRGVTHELVRHRLCAFSQESTRYVNYSGEMEFIRPVWLKIQLGICDHLTYENSTGDNWYWLGAMLDAEKNYNDLLKRDWRPEQAREVLPNSLKTEIVVTANLREWRHIFNLRCSKKAHPQIRALMQSCLKGFKEQIPVIFDNLYPEE
jgi:thymidylate synthase (FAD)